MYTGKCFLAALFFCGMFVAPTCFAGKETDVNVTYAGAGFDLTDPDADGYAMNVFLTESKGTFGKSSFMVLSEFANPVYPHADCAVGFMHFDLVRCVSTWTTANLDQLWGFYTDGYLCMNAAGDWYGEASGTYNGGTGRFNMATGEWTTEYSGANFDHDSGYRTISGTVTGTVIEP